MNSFIAGDPLLTVKNRLDQHLEFIRHHKQGPWLALALITQQYLLNLMEKTENPQLLGVHCDEQKIGQDWLCPTNNDKFSFQLQDSILWALRLLLAYHFGDIDLALKSGKNVRALEDVCKSTIFIAIHYFYDGMSVLEAAHSGDKKRKRISSGRATLKKLEKIAGHQSYCLPMVFLMRAELEALKRNLGKAMDWYSLAQVKAKEQRGIQFHALAFERAAIAQQRLGSMEKAAVLMRYARVLYEEWGAVAVSKHLREFPRSMSLWGGY